MDRNKIIIFVSGVAVGFVCGHFLTKHVLAKRNESVEEIEEENQESMYEVEPEVPDEPPVEEPEEEEVRVKHDVFDYSGLTRQFGYNNEKKDEADVHYAPYPISQAEYDDPSYQDYDQIVLTWYADNVLARDDDNDAVIMNPEQVVGPTALSQFADPNVDVVYVRDDTSCIQYEIDRDHKKYEEVVGRLDEEDDA